MLKEEYREAHERDMELYDKSILSHDDDRTDSVNYPPLKVVGLP